MNRHSKSLRLAAISLLAVASASAQTLPQTVGFGSAAFVIDVDNSLPHTQGASSLTINGPFLLGEGFGGGFLDAGSPTSYDWSAATGFSLNMSVSASSSILFTLDFFDAGAANVARYTGSTDGLTGDLTDVTLAQVFQDDMTAVVGMQLTFDDAGSFNTTLQGLTAVPEPSTWALLAMASVVFGFFVWRRRFAVARR